MLLWLQLAKNQTILVKIQKNVTQTCIHVKGLIVNYKIKH